MGKRSKSFSTTIRGIASGDSMETSLSTAHALRRSVKDQPRFPPVRAPENGDPRGAMNPNAASRSEFSTSAYESKPITLPVPV